MRNARLFIRNDDVCTLDASFRFFFDQAISRNLPVIYAVIPGTMEEGLVRFLSRAKERTPHLLDIVQHGWQHRDYSTNEEKSHEFGISRPQEAQRRDIRKGLKKMRDAFGDIFTPVFVPPFHQYDERTLQILQEEGFRGFSSARRKEEEGARLVELPTHISFSRYYQGDVSLNTAADMVEMLVKNIRRVPLSGLVTHHKDFKTNASRKELTRFFDLIGKLRSRKELDVLLFSGLIGHHQ